MMMVNVNTFIHCDEKMPDHQRGEKRHQTRSDALGQPVAQAVVRADNNAFGTVIDCHDAVFRFLVKTK